MKPVNARRLDLSLVALLILFLPYACTHSEGEGLDRLTIQTSNGDHVFFVEIADTPLERQIGLMERTDLKRNQGMLFLFPEDVQDPFWMKNTPLSLDIIFIDEDGRVLQIAPETVPYSEEHIYPQQAYRYVLEVLAGVSAEIDLQPGDLIQSEALYSPGS